MDNHSEKVKDFLVRFTKVEQLNKAGAYDKVLPLCQKNLQIAKELKSYLLMGYCLFVIGEAYKEKGQTKEALMSLNQAYSALSKADSDEEILDYMTSESLKITALVGLAFTALQLQQPKQALVILKQLKTNLRSNSDKNPEIGSSQEKELEPLIASWLAWAYNQQGDYKKALQMITHASKILPQSEDSAYFIDNFFAPSKISILWQKGVTYANLDRKAEGKKLCQAALKLALDNNQKDYTILIKKSLKSFES